MDVRTAAREYTARGFFVVPIPHGQKGPRRPKWQDLRLSQDQIDKEFALEDNVGVLLGEPSGWIVDVDLDCEEAVRLAPQYLPATGCVTGRAGRDRSHYWYRSEGTETSRHKDAADGSTVVELRSTGLQTVVGPSTHPDGGVYDVLTGEPASVPYPMLRACVEALYHAVLKERGRKEDGQHGQDGGYCVFSALPVDSDRGLRPGDDYNQRGDLHALLLSHGWRVTGKGHDGNIQLTRPGKSSGISATFRDGVFYLFSSSVPGFEPDRGYSPFEVYTRLEHGGDHAAAASALAAHGFGNSESVDYGIDYSALLNNAKGVSSNGIQDFRPDSGNSGLDRVHLSVSGSELPRPYRGAAEFPNHLLNVPGFIGEYCDYTLRTAYAKQPVLTLFGGICLQAALASRKLTDPFGNQTSLYVVCLAESGTGKDRPRKVNREILSLAGSGIEGPEDLASDSGLLSAISENPGCLLQIDEIGKLLTVVNQSGASAGHLYNIQTLMLRLYSSVGSIYKGKAYGDRRKNVEVYMPCPVIYGSTVPDSFWGSMSSESISDGFLARLIPVVGDEDPECSTPFSQPVPQSLIDHAQEWDRRTYGSGNLAAQCPSPPVAPYDDAAMELMRSKSDEWRQRARTSNEWRPVWVRAAEKASRLALVYAASRSSESPQIDAEAYQWASDVIEWSTELYESMGTHKIADSEFERKCSRVYDAIAKRDDYLTNRELLWHRSYKSLSQRERGEVMGVLVADGRVESCESSIGSLAWRAVGR
jgi:hypothetical protein